MKSFLLLLALALTAHAAERPNILWLSCEDISPDLGCYGQDYAITPNLDRFAANGVRFTNAIGITGVCAVNRSCLITGMYSSSLGSHESQVWEQNHARHVAKLTPPERHDPARAPIPPFHPDTPEVRRDWANYHDNITGLDHWFAEKLRELKAAGLAADTIVFFFSDHGAGMPGVKKWVWEGGLRLPLLIHYPEKWSHLAPKTERDPGTVTDRIVSFVDFAPTVLSLCGLDLPKHLQGTAFAGPKAGQPRTEAYVIRDRMAERYDFVRGVRDKQFLYLRNFMPHLPWSQHVSYTHKMPTMQVWQRLHEEGKLNKVQDRYFRPKPPEELYDLAADPHCVRNLAADSTQADRLMRMRKLSRQWQLDTRDLGPLPWFEIERRSQGKSPYEFARDEDAYPLEKILAAADRAAERHGALIRHHVPGLKDADPAIRWWSAQALVMLGDEVPEVADELRALLSDENPVVRVAAAEFLAAIGDAETALPVLTRALAHDSPDVRLRAINVLDRMGEAARPALEAMRQSAMKKAPFPADYLNRMADYVPAGFDAK